MIDRMMPPKPLPFSSDPAAVIGGPAQGLDRSGTAVQALGLPACWRSDELLAGAREVHIAHEGSLYRLRLTALGKLILTK